MPLLFTLFACNHLTVGEGLHPVSNPERYSKKIDEVSVDFAKIGGICLEGESCSDSDDSYELAVHTTEPQIFPLFVNPVNSRSMMIPSGNVLTYFLNDYEDNGMSAVMTTVDNTALIIDEESEAIEVVSDTTDSSGDYSYEEYGVTADFMTSFAIKTGDVTICSAPLNFSIASDDGREAYRVHGLSTEKTDVYMGGYLFIADLIENDCMHTVFDMASEHINPDDFSHLAFSMSFLGLSDVVFDSPEL